MIKPAMSPSKRLVAPTLELGLDQNGTRLKNNAFWSAG
jgi:hypothetical protein